MTSAGQIVQVLNRPESPELGFIVEATDGRYAFPWIHYVRAKISDVRHVEQTLEVTTSSTKIVINGFNLLPLLADFRSQRVSYLAIAVIAQMDGNKDIPIIRNITAKEI